MAFVAVMGGAVVLVVTGPFGLFLSADGTGYVTLARHFIDGQGWTNSMGDVAGLTQPPAYPLILVGVGLLGIDPAEGARYVNAMAFSLTVLIAGRWLIARVREPGIVWLAVAAIFVSPALLWMSFSLLSESVFILFVTAALVYAERYLLSGARRPLIWFALFTALAITTRYPGATLVLVAGLLVALRRGADLRRRALDGALFLAIALLPGLGWLARNQVVSGSAFGERRPATADLLTVTGNAFRTIAKWILPDPALGGAVFAVGAYVALVALVGMIVALLWKARGQWRTDAWLSGVPWAAFALLYLLFIIVTKSRIGILEPRYLTPFFLPFFVAAGYFVGYAFASWRVKFARERVFLAGMVTAGVMWLAMGPATTSARLIGETFTQGSFALISPDGGHKLSYNSAWWRNREIVHALEQGVWHEADIEQAVILSNHPELVSWWAGKSARLLPSRKLFYDKEAGTNFARTLVAHAKAGRPVYVVEFKSWRTHMVHSDDLRQMASLKGVLNTADGSGMVYKLTPLPWVDRLAPSALE